MISKSLGQSRLVKFDKSIAIPGKLPRSFNPWASIYLPRLAGWVLLLVHQQKGTCLAAKYSITSAIAFSTSDPGSRARKTPL
jgi:hypothetical protein